MTTKTMKKIKITNKKVAKYVSAKVYVGTVIYILRFNEEKPLFVSEAGTIFSNDKLKDVLVKKKNWYKMIPFKIKQEGKYLLEKIEEIRNGLADSKKVNHDHVCSLLAIEVLINLSFEIK